MLYVYGLHIAQETHTVNFTPRKLLFSPDFHLAPLLLTAFILDQLKGANIELAPPPPHPTNSQR
jgi:hypothetical protein